MKLPTTPLFGSDVCEGFGEVPAMAVKVLSIVLALSIGVIFRFAQDDSPVVPRTFAMANGIFDTHLNALGMVGRDIALGDGEAALPRFHLDAVIGNAQTNGEAKGLRQPIGCCARVGVNEHRNHGAWRHRSVES